MRIKLVVEFERDANEGNPRGRFLGGRVPEVERRVVGGLVERALTAEIDPSKDDGPALGVPGGKRKSTQRQTRGESEGEGVGERVET